MAGIVGKELSVFLDFIRELKEQLIALIFSLEKGLHHDLPLREIAGKFARIAGGSAGLFPVLPVHKGGNGFVHGDILCGKIVVILIIGIKIFQLFLVDGNNQRSLVPFPLKMAALPHGRD